MMRQGVGVNAFTTQATSKKVKATVDAFTGKATLEFKDIKELDSLTVNTLIDYIEVGGSKNRRIINIHWNL